MRNSGIQIGTVKDFRELAVWQKAHQLTLAVYQITAGFPREELAEGCGRNGDAEFARFCSIAMGSASELKYQLLLAKDLKLITPKDNEELSQRATELKRMLTALHKKLRAEN